MLWSHHLLATSKRKDILAWSTELSLLGCSRIGYPGMIVALGGEDEVDEFVKRLKVRSFGSCYVALTISTYRDYNGMRYRSGMMRSSRMQRRRGRRRHGRAKVGERRRALAR